MKLEALLAVQLSVVVAKIQFAMKVNQTKEAQKLELERLADFVVDRTEVSGLAVQAAVEVAFDIAEDNLDTDRLELLEVQRLVAYLHQFLEDHNVDTFLDSDWVGTDFDLADIAQQAHTVLDPCNCIGQALVDREHLSVVIARCFEMKALA